MNLGKNYYANLTLFYELINVTTKFLITLYFKHSLRYMVWTFYISFISYKIEETTWNFYVKVYVMLNFF